MIHHQFRAAPGLALAARLELPLEVGPDVARFYLGPGGWTADPSARIAVEADRVVPGLYSVTVASAFVEGLAAATLWLAVLDAAAGGPPVGLWPFPVPAPDAAA